MIKTELSELKALCYKIRVENSVYEIVPICSTNCIVVFCFQGKSNSEPPVSSDIGLSSNSNSDLEDGEEVSYNDVIMVRENCAKYIYSRFSCRPGKACGFRRECE